MIVTIGKWKSWQRQTLGLEWQENFFDHRNRDDREFQEKADYIRKNPVVKDLCATPEEWPWVLDQTTVTRWLEVGAGVPAGVRRR